MPSAAPGQPLPPPAPGEPHWPGTADPTPPFVRRVGADDLDDLEAPGWVNAPSAANRPEPPEDHAPAPPRDADRFAQDRLISAIKVFIGIFLPGMLLVIGVGFFVSSLGSDSTGEQDNAPATANSSPVAAQASAASGTPADPLVGADGLAASFAALLGTGDLDAAAAMTGGRLTADRLEQLFGTSDDPLSVVPVDTDPAGRERYTVRLALLRGGDEPSVRCVDLDVVPLAPTLVDVSSEPQDVTAAVAELVETGVDRTAAVAQACLAANLAALRD